MKILIVEDEPLIAEDIAEILQKNEFVVTNIAYSKEFALSELSTNLPDMALLDINLNNKMDGIEIAQIIQANYQIPFIFITSYSDKNTLEKAKLTEPSGYIVKPFNERTLLASLEIAISNHAAEKNHDLPKLSSEKLNKHLLLPFFNNLC